MTTARTTTIALDIDEVMASFLPAINAWYNKEYGTKHKTCEYETYYFGDVWNADYDTTIEIVYKFFESDEFKNLESVPGAVEAVEWLRTKFRLVVITSRQNIIQEATKEWLDRKFGPGTFAEVMFGNIWIPRRTPSDPGADSQLRTPPPSGAVVPTKRSKREMCIEANAKCLVDDQPKYINDVKYSIELPILFNFKKTYPWIKELDPEDLVAHDWCEVLHHIRRHFDLEVDAAYNSAIEKVRSATLSARDQN